MPPLDSGAGSQKPQSGAGASADALSEDDIKRLLTRSLEERGWQVQVAWGHERGVDVTAVKDGRRWIIEAKGCGSRPEMRVNYFLAVLGTLLQRMSDPDALYSIAVPDMPQFRRLWERLPAIAKQRLGATALFVSEGAVEEAT